MVAEKVKTTEEQVGEVREGLENMMEALSELREQKERLEERYETLLYIVLRWAYEGYDSEPARKRALWELTRKAAQGVAYGSDEYHIAVLTGGRGLKVGENAPLCPGPAPEDAGAILDGTNFGDTPRRYSIRPGAMHQGSAGLPSTGARRS